MISRGQKREMNCNSDDNAPSAKAAGCGASDFKTEFAKELHSCTCTHLCRCAWRPDGHQVTAAGVREACELPDLGVGSQTWILCERHNCS